MVCDESVTARGRCDVLSTLTVWVVCVARVLESESMLGTMLFPISDHKHCYGVNTRGARAYTCDEEGCGGTGRRDGEAPFAGDTQLPVYTFAVLRCVNLMEEKVQQQL